MGVAPTGLVGRQSAAATAGSGIGDAVDTWTRAMARKLARRARTEGIVYAEIEIGYERIGLSNY